MGFKKVKKQDGTTAIIQTGKGSKGIVGNLGSDQAQNGISLLERPDGSINPYNPEVETFDDFQKRYDDFQKSLPAEDRSDYAASWNARIKANEVLSLSRRINTEHIYQQGEKNFITRMKHRMNGYDKKGNYDYYATSPLEKIRTVGTVAAIAGVAAGLIGGAAFGVFAVDHPEAFHSVTAATVVSKDHHDAYTSSTLVCSGVKVRTCTPMMIHHAESWTAHVQGANADGNQESFDMEISQSIYNDTALGATIDIPNKGNVGEQFGSWLNPFDGFGVNTTAK